MAKIVISENITLDGMVQDPTGEEGFERGGWFGQARDLPGWARLALQDALGAEALLLGRRTYEYFAARWPSRSGELADRLNSLPKYVVSSTLEDPDWNNSIVVKGDVVQEVSRLRTDLNGQILCLASFHLVRTLIDRGLVDELRLKVFPVVLGAGERLFGNTGDTIPLRLVDTTIIDAGVSVLTYKPIRLSAASAPELQGSAGSKA
jgi:dihydrofolate reductase